MRSTLPALPLALLLVLAAAPAFMGEAQAWEVTSCPATAWPECCPEGIVYDAGHGYCLPSARDP